MTIEAVAERLLPCPFCGNAGPDLLDLIAPLTDDENPSLVIGPAHVHCSACGAMKWGDDYDEDSAIAAWNRRTPASGAGVVDDDEEREVCFICAVPFKDGDTVLDDVSGERAHRTCYGDDRECFVKDLDTGEPLGPDDPLPVGYRWDAPISSSPPPDREAVPFMWVLEHAGGFDPQNGGEPPSTEFLDEPKPGAFPLYRHPQVQEKATAWLHVNRATGTRELRFDDLDDLPFNRERWISTPLYAPATLLKDQGSAMSTITDFARTTLAKLRGTK